MKCVKCVTTLGRRVIHLGHPLRPTVLTDLDPYLTPTCTNCVDQLITKYLL